MEFAHTPIMLDEVLDGLNIHPDGIYLDGSWYLLRIRPQYRSDDPVAGLDVSILQNRILTPILGIGDPKTDTRIEFVGGIRGTKELEQKADSFHGVSFLMYPTSLHVRGYGFSVHKHVHNKLFIANDKSCLFCGQLFSYDTARVINRRVRSNCLKRSPPVIRESR